MKKGVIIFVLALFVLPLVSSTPPFQTNQIGGNGLDLAGVDFSVIKTSTDRTAAANVYNSSSGLPFYTGVSCQFQVFSVADTGALIFKNDKPTRVYNTFFFGIPNTVYNSTNEYTRIIQCNTSTVGGFYKSTFIANPPGRLLDVSEGTLYSILFFMGLLFFIISVGAGIGIDGKNKSDQMTGYVIALNNKKYLKMFAWAIAYLLLVVMLYAAYNLSFAYLPLSILTNLFYFAYTTSLILILPLFILAVYLVIANAVRDAKIGDMLSRGLRTK